MTIEVIDSDGQRILNPQGIDVEVGNDFPEVEREITHDGQVHWLKSSPTSDLEPESPVS